MDLYQEIQVINPKDKNVSPEERHKWRMPELPPVNKAQELIYSKKAAGVGTSAKPLDSENKLIPSSEEALRPRKERGHFERMESNVCQRESQTDKSLVEKPKDFITGVEEAVGPKERQQCCGSSTSPQKQESSLTSTKHRHKIPQKQPEGQCKV
ncbi:hypothetical protein O181_132350 [Austropuccinia psidii MF-1]|uniref:Uncharacterized protein n=1 Tax=Austropuccinia psidii MF-1 TaxID=1389203 RepID=A0A9Q3L2N1_9BASI|nr:hypothetical protein [Austropuccinia psidii MF-1]